MVNDSQSIAMKFQNVFFLCKIFSLAQRRLHFHHAQEATHITKYLQLKSLFF